MVVQASLPCCFAACLSRHSRTLLSTLIQAPLTDEEIRAANRIAMRTAQPVTSAEVRAELKGQSVTDKPEPEGGRLVAGPGRPLSDSPIVVDSSPEGGESEGPKTEEGDEKPLPRKRPTAKKQKKEKEKGKEKEKKKAQKKKVPTQAEKEAETTDEAKEEETKEDGKEKASTDSSSSPELPKGQYEVFEVTDWCYGTILFHLNFSLVRSFRHSYRR